jgi:cytochrome c peroxidase
VLKLADRGAGSALRVTVAAVATLLIVLPGQQRIYAQAIVGPTHFATPVRRPALTPETLKEEYRRPSVIPFPRENPYTPAKASLGKRLYFDTRLSGSSALSCASCHSPAFGWGDGLPKGVGHGMQPLGRRSPTIVNPAWGQIFMWDGRAATLEEQALGPIQADAEMNMPLPVLMDRLARISEYQPLFDAVFPGDGTNPKHLAKAIATYERTVASGPAPFDAWLDGHRAGDRRGGGADQAHSRCEPPTRSAPFAGSANASRT